MAQLPSTVFFWLNLSAKTEKNAPKRDLSFSWRLGVDTINPDNTRWVFCLMALRSTFTACLLRFAQLSVDKIRPTGPQDDNSAYRYRKFSRKCDQCDLKIKHLMW